MTPARRAELIAGVEAALAMEGGVLTGREHIEAMLLWFATSLPVMDAVLAGYMVTHNGGAPDVWWLYCPRNPPPRVVYDTQADAWRAALRHMA